MQDHFANNFDSNFKENFGNFFGRDAVEKNTEKIIEHADNQIKANTQTDKEIEDQIISSISRATESEGQQENDVIIPNSQSRRQTQQTEESEDDMVECFRCDGT